MVEEQVYVAVKASLHSSETSVFGLDKDELTALSKRFEISPEVINGYILTSNPISVINSLSELGYKVVCSSGEAEIVWTLRRAFIKQVMGDLSNHHTCNHSGGTSSVSQSLDEMDFERGIWSAALDGDEDRVEKLLQKGAAPNAYDAGGYTALHYAARAGHSSTCELLIKKGADVNAQTRAGRATALHRAVTAGQDDTVAILLKHNAKPDILDGDGNTCLQRAIKSENKKMIELLQHS